MQNRRPGYQKEYYYRRVRDGWCPICPNEIINPKFVYCFKCRRKRAKYQAKRRKNENRNMVFNHRTRTIR